MDLILLTSVVDNRMLLENLKERLEKLNAEESVEKEKDTIAHSS
jgi:hypothetical protein